MTRSRWRGQPPTSVTDGAQQHKRQRGPEQQTAADEGEFSDAIDRVARCLDSRRRASDGRLRRTHGPAVLAFDEDVIVMYMVLMYADPAETKAMSAAEREAVRRRHEALHTGESAVMVSGAGLAYPERTVTVRLDGSGPVVSEGPFLAGREQRGC